MLQYLYAAALVILFACKSDEGTTEITNPDDDVEVVKPDEMPKAEFAKVTKVSVSGSENAYSFSVTISSPDTGCEQYADWWEVFDEDEKLLYRRILAHSHVNEQPFTRSGGSVAVSATQKVWVRAHMNNTGYGTQTLFGSVNDGFEEKITKDDFAIDLEGVDPQPGECAF